ncbi:MAG: ABC transporter permease [Armatimonadota bacterium]
MLARLRLGQLLRASALFLGLATIFTVAAIVGREKNFLTWGNQTDIFTHVSINGVLAVGMTFVILTAGIDLSVGRMLGLGSVVCAMLLMQRGPNWAFWVAQTSLALSGLLAGWVTWAALGRWMRRSDFRLVASVLIGLGWGIGLSAWGAMQMPTGFSVLGVLVAVPAVGLMFGLLSGLMIAKGRLQPFIGTLAMMVSAHGAARLIAGGRIQPLTDTAGVTEPDPWFAALRSSYIGPLHFPVPAAVFLLCVVVAFVVLRTQRFGRHVYAVGGNEEAARLSGINVDRTKIAVYAVSGALAGLGGLLYCARYRQGYADALEATELDAIAAVVIGGTSLMGGRGSITGTFVGVLIFGYLNNILQLEGVHTNWQLLLKGIIIVLAVWLQEGQLGSWARGLWQAVRSRPTPEGTP